MIFSESLEWVSVCFKFIVAVSYWKFAKIDSYQNGWMHPWNLSNSILIIHIVITALIRMNVKEINTEINENKHITNVAQY